MTISQLSQSQNWTPELAVDQLAKIINSSPKPSDLVDSVVLTKMKELGVPHLTADLAYKFTQIAWSRLLLDGMGVEFSSDYFCFNGAGNVIEQGVFVKQPFFVAAVKLAKNYSQSENFKMFAFMSADVSALNAALNQGSQPEDLVFSPACLFLEPTTSEGMEKAQKYISLKMSYKNSKKAAPASTPIQNKPWWKF